MMKACIWIFIGLMLFLGVLLVRNEWVYRKRVDLIIEDYETYKKLKSYKEMMRKFWIWDINKFIDNTETEKK